MRDSINYNLKYIIMKTSDTKPMKNTMRKKSPLKFSFASVVKDAGKKAAAKSDAGTATAKKETTTKSTPTTKPARPAGKPDASAKPAVKKASATVKKVADAATKGAIGKTALMQMKKNKC